MPVVHLPIAMVTLLVDWGYGDFLVSPHRHTGSSEMFSSPSLEAVIASQLR